jgi:hypothetical protein
MAAQRAVYYFRVASKIAHAAQARQPSSLMEMGLDRAGFAEFFFHTRE